MNSILVKQEKKRTKTVVLFLLQQLAIFTSLLIKKIKINLFNVFIIIN
jgi:hypothetical protein